MVEESAVGAPPPGFLILAEEVWGAPLHAMRSVADLGARVLVVTHGRGAEIFGRSRVRPLTLDLGGPVDRDYLSCALGWARAQLPDREIVVVPCSDRLAAAMHGARDLLRLPFRPVLAPAGALDRLLRKPDSLRWAADLGLSVPDWVEVRSQGDIAGLRSLRPPLVIKPADSLAERSPFKISVHENHSTAEAFALRALAAGTELLVQEYVRAAEDQIEFAFVWGSADGELVRVCTGRKRRASSRAGGVMAWGESCVRPDVAAAATRFVAETGFTGPGGIEFVRTSSGALSFIEFNPRLEANHFLAAAAGHDAVAWSYRDVGLRMRSGASPAQVAATAWVGSAWMARVLGEPSAVAVMFADRVAFARSPRRRRAVLVWSDPRPARALAVRVLRGVGRRAALRRRSGVGAS